MIEERTSTMKAQDFLATILYGKIAPEDTHSFQSPSNLSTRRRAAERPSEEGLI
jgi:hypothetical protein